MQNYLIVFVLERSEEYTCFNCREWITDGEACSNLFVKEYAAIQIFVLHMEKPTTTTDDNDDTDNDNNNKNNNNNDNFCLLVSLLSHFWRIHFFHLRLLYQPHLGLCQAPCVQSHQRQPMSAVAIIACEVQVSAADSQTIPAVVTGVSKPLCCRLTTTFTLTSVPLYYFYFTGPYTTMQPTLLTSWLQLLSYKV